MAANSPSFYRHKAGTDWYDEVRCDSHEMRKGKDTQAPHFHMKLRSAFKTNDAIAIEEIRSIIDNQLKAIEEVLEQ